MLETTFLELCSVRKDLIDDKLSIVLHDGICTQATAKFMQSSELDSSHDQSRRGIYAIINICNTKGAVSFMITSTSYNDLTRRYQSASASETPFKLQQVSRAFDNYFA